MRLEQIRALCMSFPGATEQIQWGDDLLFKVAGKMFLVTGFKPASPFTIKAADEAFHELTELAGIHPAPYLARAKWVQIIPAECRLRPAEIEALIRESYDLVVARLPKRAQKALQEGSRQKRSARKGKRAKRSTL